MRRALLACAAALLLCVPAAAEPFEAQVAGASALLGLRFAAVKPPPPPALPAGTPERYARAFADGFSSAARALSKSSCAAFFAGRGAAAPRPLETMRAAEYRFLALPQGPSVGAQTNSENSVFINTTGLFVTAEGGGVVLAGRDYDLGSASAVRAMILLHELSHQLGIFGPDSGPAHAADNASHSLDVINACLYARPL